MKTPKKWLIASLMVFALFNVAYARTQGKVIEQRTVKSSILSRDVKYTVYLPADYESSERTYPVVYLLHGYTDDNTGWLQFEKIKRWRTGIVDALHFIGDNFRQK